MTSSRTGLASSGVSFDGLRRVKEMPVGSGLALGAEFPEVNLLVPYSLPGGLDGEVVLNHRRNEAFSLEE
jgi:hypothetical protein